jgi:hypothetical protein
VGKRRGDVTSRRTAWLAFLVLGVLDGVVLLSFPSLGFVILALGLAGIAVRPPRVAALAGLVTGVGAIWSLLLIRVAVSCDAFNREPGQSCESPGIEGWILVGLVVLVIGVVGSVFLVVRSGPTSPG